MDRGLARERMKRRMIAERIKNGYKYRDPSKIPVEGSAAAQASENAERQHRRPEPFARPRGR